MHPQAWPSLLRLARILEGIVAAISLAVARVALPSIILLGTVQVLSRNFRWNIEAHFLELQAVLFFAFVVTSFAYGFVRDAHARIDVLSTRFPHRARALLEIVAAIGVLAPICAILIWYGGGSTWRSFDQGEMLGDTGLPLEWLVRATVPLGFSLLLVAALAGLLRKIAALRGDAEL